MNCHLSFLSELLAVNKSKHFFPPLGATSSGLSICSGKLLEESPFGHFDISMKSLASPPGSVGDGWPSAKSPSDKLSSNVNWPPGKMLCIWSDGSQF